MSPDYGRQEFTVNGKPAEIGAVDGYSAKLGWQRPKLGVFDLTEGDNTLDVRGPRTEPEGEARQPLRPGLHLPYQAMKGSNLLFSKKSRFDPLLGYFFTSKPRLRSSPSILGSAPRNRTYWVMGSSVPNGSRMFLRNDSAVALSKIPFSLNAS